jgi:hypothetical protein
MIPAPCLIVRTSSGITRKIEALKPVRVPSLAVWNAQVRAWNGSPAA